MTTPTNDHVIYEPDEPIPAHVALGHGFQSIMGRLSGLAASTAIIAQASGQPESYVSWIFFVSLAVCGAGTILQTFRIGRFGSGYPLGVSNGSAYIAVAVSALIAGGPALLSSLIIVSALLQFVLGSRLSLLRRVLTPTVTGTVLMLMAASVMPVLLSKLSITPEGASDAAAPAVAGVTFAIVVGLRLFGPPTIKQWGPAIAIVGGCVLAVPLGLFDIQPFIEAGWIGIPLDARPGLDFGLSAEFFALLPGFVIVVMATSMYSISDMVTIQQVSWRRPRATDFRVIQGALNVVVVTNLASALLGSLPNMVPPGNSPKILLTGVAARRIGIYAGGILIAVAFLPKLIALITAIPGAIFGAYVVVMLAILFVQGMRLVVGAGINARVAAVVGVSFWLGVGFQNQLIFPDLLSGAWATLLSNGLTTGSISLIFFTVLLEVTTPRSSRLRTTLDMASLPAIDELLLDAASRAGWDEASTDRLRSAGEEALSSLLPVDVDGAEDSRRLVISARPVEERMELEFVAASDEDASDEENLEDRLAYLSDQPQLQNDRELSFRLLRHYAYAVQHRKYHGLDIVTVEVERTR